jgi:hypothetical protein
MIGEYLHSARDVLICRAHHEGQQVGEQVGRQEPPLINHDDHMDRARQGQSILNTVSTQSRQGRVGYTHVDLLQCYVPIPLSEVDLHQGKTSGTKRMNMVRSAPRRSDLKKDAYHQPQVLAKLVTLLPASPSPVPISSESSHAVRLSELHRLPSSSSVRHMAHIIFRRVGEIRTLDIIPIRSLVVVPIVVLILVSRRGRVIVFTVQLDEIVGVLLLMVPVGTVVGVGLEGHGRQRDWAGERVADLVFDAHLASCSRGRGVGAIGSSG